MESIFQVLNSAIAASQQSVELNGREIFCRRAIVTNNNDPDNQRRIKVALASKGGQLESNWIQRCNSAPAIDEPLPKIGQTVIVFSVDGNPHDGVYLGVLTNDPNSALEKMDPIADHQQAIDGQSKTSTGKDYSIDCGTSLRLQNAAGAFLELNEAGFVILGDAYGHRWILGGAGGSGWQWDAAGASIEVVNAANFSINGKQISTVGAIDSRGDQLVQRGW